MFRATATADSSRRFLSRALIALLLFASVTSAFAADTGPSIKNDTLWKDDRGQEIMWQGGNFAKLITLKGHYIGSSKATPESLAHIAKLPLEFLELGDNFGTAASIPVIKDIETTSIRNRQPRTKS